ncbi:MAG: ATP-dependent zinc metalloprotease FtsH [Myxococcota bacterium]|nr:ATP-dependent zinc metalloprotease FtsH [Myxococcota bacterium]
MQDKPENRVIWLFVALGLLFIVVLSIQDLLHSPISWTEAKQKIESGQVESVEIDSHLVRLRLKESDTELRTDMLETVFIEQDESFFPLLDKNQVTVKAVGPSNCEEGSSWLFTFFLIGLIVYMVIRMQRTGSSNPFARSKASLASPESSTIRFTDVAGIDEAREELEELVAILKQPQRFRTLGGRMPKGVLLVGPPGTGKTLLAKAVAGEADVPFFHTSGSDFVEIYVGVGAARVRDLFEQAKKKAPCIIFIDEFDAIAKSRSSRNLNGNDEREQTLNQLLVAMDGFDSQQGIIVIAATNRPDSLDSAVTRPGRFDRQVHVQLPDIKGRRAILEIHAKNIQLDDEINLDMIARLTPGFSGADLANILNEAALLTIRKAREKIGLVEIEEAIERSIAGLAHKNRHINEDERRRIAFHEGGHALCAAALPVADPVQKISIIPRGRGALGYTMQNPEQDQNLYTHKQLYSKIVILFGGRAAEEHLFSDYTTGAADDLRRASDIARQMIRRYGMSEALGPMSFERDENRFVQELSPSLISLLDQEESKILKEAYHHASSIIQQNEDLLRSLGQQLLEEETLSGDKLDELLSRTQEYRI